VIVSSSPSSPIRRLAGAAALVVAALTLSASALAKLPADADTAARLILADERYRFCHEADYPLTRDEHAWCPILIESSEICPSLAQACTLPPVEGNAEARPSRRNAEKPPAEKPVEQPKQPLPADDRQREEPARITVAPSLSVLSQVLFIAVILGFVIIVGRAIARSFFSGGADAAPPEEPRADSIAKIDAPAPRGPVETDVERLLARARAAGARGEYARAIDDAYAALLRRLDGDGHIDIHPSRTNGDYVRQLRNHAELRGPVREVVREVERVHFGATAPSERAFRAVLDRVVPLVSRALAAALFCVGLSAVVSCSPIGVEETRTASAGTSPSGTLALMELLARRDFEVERRAEALDQIAGTKTLVLLSSTRIDAATWAHLLVWVDKGGRLVLAGVRSLPPDLGLTIGFDTLPGTVVEVDDDVSHLYGEHVLRVPAGPELRRADGDTREVPNPLLLRGEATYAAAFVRGEGHIVVFADDRLFTNAALAVRDNAAFLVRLFESMPGPRQVELGDAWTGVGASTPFAAVAHAELVPVILQLFALLALLYLWKGTPFARLRDPPAETRRAFADHARALGLAYGRARASKHVVGLYATWALDRLRERVQRSGRQGLSPLAEAISTRTGRPEAEVMRVLVDAACAREEAAPPSLNHLRSARFDARRKPPTRDEIASEFALMRELEGFLSATGRRRPARRSSKENTHA
jgi:hypothetical protein